MNGIEDRRWAIARRAAKVTAMMLTVGLAAFGCAPGQRAQEQEPLTTEVATALDRARAAADRLGLRLMAELGGQLQTGTPASVINVCTEIAPAAAEEISRDGIRIRRTSLKVRNPASTPDGWERARLERYEEIVAGGGQATEVFEVVDGEEELRYLRPIVVGDVCLACHGTAETLDPEVRRQVTERYPEDRATGFSAGDLRGAFSVRVRLEAKAL